MSASSRIVRPNQDFRATPSASTSAILGRLEALDNVLRLSLDGSQRRPAAARPSAPVPEAPAARPAQRMPDFGTAFDLLGRASEAMDALQSRCDELENSAKVRADHCKMALDVAHQQLRTSVERAAAFEAQLADSAALLAAANARADAAEKRAQLAEQSATDASEWLKVYYERIITAFGMRAHPDMAGSAE